MRKNWLVFAFVIFLCGCKTEPEEQLDNLKKLEGDWVGTTTGGTFLESWEILNDTVMQGKGTFIHMGDTIFREDLSITREDNTKVYKVTLPNRNGGEAISYRMVSETEGKIVFENPEHDYPQRITYKIKADSVYATLEGEKNGAKSTEVIKLGRKDQ